MSAELLALLDEDPATGIWVAADELEHEAGRCADAEGAFRWTDPADGARLVEWMRASARHWRAVVRRHGKYTERAVNGDPIYLEYCNQDGSVWPCTDLIETAAEARAFLGDKP
jgi:hypothetical protein